MAEVLRNGAEAGRTAVKEDSEEKRLPIFWRVFGGTLLSISALVVMTVYQQFSNGLHDLRNDMGHLNTDLRKELGRLSETQADLVKKEEFASRMTSVWDSVRTLQGERNELTILKERCALLVELHKGGEEERRKLANELRTLREQKAGSEERRELTRELQFLCERLAKLEGRQSAQTAINAKDTEE